MDPRVVLAADVAFAAGEANANEAAAAIREDRLLSDPPGRDALRTIVRRGGIDRAIHRVLGPRLSRELSDLGAGPRAPLRSLDPDRYLDFSGANQLRVLLAAAAFAILQELRTRLRGTGLARAQVERLRLCLLRIGARIERSSV